MLFTFLGPEIILFLLLLFSLSLSLLRSSIFLSTCSSKLRQTQKASASSSPATMMMMMIMMMLPDGDNDHCHGCMRKEGWARDDPHTDWVQTHSTHTLYTRVKGMSTGKGTRITHFTLSYSCPHHTATSLFCIQSYVLSSSSNFLLELGFRGETAGRRENPTSVPFLFSHFTSQSQWMTHVVVVLYSILSLFAQKDWRMVHSEKRLRENTRFPSLSSLLLFSFIRNVMCQLQQATGFSGAECNLSVLCYEWPDHWEPNLYRDPHVSKRE